MSNNKNLTNAKSAKQDEFYTQYKDVENELQHYTKHFKDKIVYCNCDTSNSNFVKYFQNNFEALGLKDLLYYAKDFRSLQSIEMLKKCDIVVTNPPFSLFKSYIKQLFDNNKKFLIVGNQNAVTYKEIFPYIYENKLWYGCSIHKGDIEFHVPKSYGLNTKGCRVNEKGEKYIRVTGVRWFTNLDHQHYPTFLKLNHFYEPLLYPKYDNYDAINVNRTSHIPADYEGIMGVPITFLDKYNPKQFKIIGNEEMLKIPKGRGYVNGKRLYSRIFIQKIK